MLWVKHAETISEAGNRQADPSRSGGHEDLEEKVATKFGKVWQSCNFPNDMDVNGRFDCHNSPQMLLENLPGLP